MKKEKGEGSKLGRWLGAPVRALSRACDSYVRKMSACAGHMPTHAAGAMGRGGGLAPGAMQAATFSSRSRRATGSGGDDDDDVGELVRALSQRQAARGVHSGEEVSVPVRSRSVAVGRIDEDAPCEFGADDARVGPVMPPHVRRSRSVAVGGGLAGGFGGAMKKGPAAVVRG